MLAGRHCAGGGRGHGTSPPNESKLTNVATVVEPALRLATSRWRRGLGQGCRRAAVREALCEVGRVAEIRTRGLHVPNVARYQAALRPADLFTCPRRGRPAWCRLPSPTDVWSP